jgi:hypothetical protein
MEGSARGAPFCKKRSSFCFLSKVQRIIERGGGETRAERPQERDKTSYIPAFVNICIDIQINRKAIFPAYCVFDVYIFLCISCFKCITSEVIQKFQFILIFEFLSARNAHSSQGVH